MLELVLLTVAKPLLLLPRKNHTSIVFYKKTPNNKAFLTSMVPDGS